MPISLAGTAVGIGGAIFGQIKGAKERKAQRKILRQAYAKLDEQGNKLKERGDELNAFYTGESNKDYLDTSEARSALSALRKNQQESQKRMADIAAVTGASEESQLANNANLNENVAETTSNLAGKGTAYKTELRQEKNQQQSQLDAMTQNLENRQMGLMMGDVGTHGEAASGWDQFSQNALGTGSSLFSQGSGLSGLLKKKKEGTGEISPDVVGSNSQNLA